MTAAPSRTRTARSSPVALGAVPTRARSLSAVAQAPLRCHPPCGRCVALVFPALPSPDAPHLAPARPLLGPHSRSGLRGVPAVCRLPVCVFGGAVSPQVTENHHPPSQATPGGHTGCGGDSADTPEGAPGALSWRGPSREHACHSAAGGSRVPTSVTRSLAPSPERGARHGQTRLVPFPRSVWAQTCRQGRGRGGPPGVCARRGSVIHSPDRTHAAPRHVMFQTHVHTASETRARDTPAQGLLPVRRGKAGSQGCWTEGISPTPQTWWHASRGPQSQAGPCPFSHPRGGSGNRREAGPGPLAPARGHQSSEGGKGPA